MINDVIEPALPHMTWLEGTLNTPAGFKAFAAEADIVPGRPDMALIWSVKPAVVSGLFTTNQVQAWPVLLTRKTVHHGLCQAIVVNAGNANAASGPQGEKDAAWIQEKIARGLSVPPLFVAVASTGVIGVSLPMDKVSVGIDKLLADWKRHSPDDAKGASEAILTTDQVPKVLAAEIDLPEGRVRLGIMAKGSGMIHPNMATMLAFIGTDLSAPRAVLKAALDEAIRSTFNAISVDGDTSTNDAVVLIATGKSGVRIDRNEGPAFARFVAVLETVCAELAHAIVRDGEGATKFVRVDVSGGRSREECQVVANTIAQSPLVKTALFASDPNWGRILMAVGRSPIALDDPNRVTVTLNGLRVFTNGAVDPAYREEQGQKALAALDIVIGVDLGQGSEKATVFTCDLSYDYVRINGSYRT